MDPLDKYLDQYIENLVNQCLQSMPENGNREEAAGKIRDYLYQVVLSAVIDNLNADQLSQLETLAPESPEMAEKIQQFASEDPNLATVIDQNLDQAVSNIKQNPAVLGQPPV